MTDPYNSAASLPPRNAQGASQPPRNPYAPPSAIVQPSSPVASRIDRLDVSAKWKDIFRLIEDAGGEKLPNVRSLEWKERRRITSNWLAFFFGPLYFLAKGLWKPALAVFGVAFAILALLAAAGFGDARIGIGVGVVCSMRANILYYKLKVLGDSGWF